MPRDPYAILALRRDATDEEITKRFRRLAMETHPDRNLGRNTAPQFVEIREAYDTLIDPRLRAAYELERVRVRARTTQQARRSVDDAIDCPTCDALDAFLRDADERLSPSREGVLRVFDALDGIAKGMFGSNRCRS